MRSVLEARPDLDNPQLPTHPTPTYLPAPKPPTPLNMPNPTPCQSTPSHRSAKLLRLRLTSQVFSASCTALPTIFATPPPIFDTHHPMDGYPPHTHFPVPSLQPPSDWGRFLGYWDLLGSGTTPFSPLPPPLPSPPQALASGVLQLVATDHAVFNSSQKAGGRRDFRRIPNGVNGIEERMHVVWQEMVVAGGRGGEGRGLVSATA